MPPQSPMRLSLLALCFSLSFAVTATAGDYASAISAYRHAHGLSAVRLDGRLNAVALTQARAMAATGTVTVPAAILLRVWPVCANPGRPKISARDS
jgi:hypothetical protein